MEPLGRARLVPPPRRPPPRGGRTSTTEIALARIEAHYFVNDSFFRSDGELLRPGREDRDDPGQSSSRAATTSVCPASVGVGSPQGVARLAAHLHPGCRPRRRESRGSRPLSWRRRRSSRDSSERPAVVPAPFSLPEEARLQGRRRPGADVASRAPPGSGREPVRGRRRCRPVGGGPPSRGLRDAPRLLHEAASSRPAAAGASGGPGDQLARRRRADRDREDRRRDAHPGEGTPLPARRAAGRRPARRPVSRAGTSPRSTCRRRTTTGSTSRARGGASRSGRIEGELWPVNAASTAYTPRLYVRNRRAYWMAEGAGRDEGLARRRRPRRGHPRRRRRPGRPLARREASALDRAARGPVAPRGAG